MPSQPTIGDQEDVLLGFNLMLELEGKAAGYFSEANGIGSEHELIEHKVVDSSGHEIVKKIPGRLKWSDITLKRGITSAMDFWDWREDVIKGNLKTARMNVSITMLSRTYEPVAIWHLSNAWPSKVTGPVMKADSNDIGVEEVVLVHEGMYREK